MFYNLQQLTEKWFTTVLIEPKASDCNFIETEKNYWLSDKMQILEIRSHQFFLCDYLKWCTYSGCDFYPNIAIPSETTFFVCFFTLTTLCRQKLDYYEAPNFCRQLFRDKLNTLKKVNASSSSSSYFHTDYIPCRNSEPVSPQGSGRSCTASWQTHSQRHDSSFGRSCSRTLCSR
jgi:hypothetical protein